MRNTSHRLVVLLLAGCAAGGCSAGLSRAEIQSADAGVRARAIVAAGERRDERAVALLVDRLDDEDDAVRLYAILALERITETRLGYDYAKPEPERRAAVARWRAFVRSRAAAPTTSAPSG